MTWKEVLDWAHRNPDGRTYTVYAVVDIGSSGRGIIHVFERPEPSNLRFRRAVAASTDNVRAATAGAKQTFQAPEPRGSLVAPDGKWFIAYGTLDKGTPSWMFSNVWGAP